MSVTCGGMMGESLLAEVTADFTTAGFYTGVFNVPEEALLDPEDEITVSLTMTGDGGDTRTYTIDGVFLAPYTSFGGFSLLAVTGLTNVEKDSSWRFTITNTYGGNYTTFFNRYLEAQMPNKAGSVLVTDANGA
jgi:hypothetical protein